MAAAGAGQSCCHKAPDSREQLFPVSLRGGGSGRDERPGKGFSVPA